MSETYGQLSAEEQKALELGILLGQRRTFGMIAGRCSAAHAECLRKIRDEKLYLKFAANWKEYCERCLKMPKSTADYTIALLKKHGPLYFETAALTGISPRQFERIAPHIQADGIHSGGEIIALIPENAQRAIDALAKLQTEAAAAEPEKPAPTVESQIREIEERAEQVCSAFRKIGRQADRKFVAASIKKMQMMFFGLEMHFR
jgi:hypothetical protein